jgi:hypothetical protein
MSEDGSSGVRIGTSAIDAATIISIALVLAAFYCVSKIAPAAGFFLLFPRLDAFDFPYWTIDYFPWTDVAGNLFLGFALAHGWPIVEAGTANHMPGVPQYLAIWFSLFGLGGATPSAQTAAAAYLVASFATLLFQAACVYVPMRLLAFSPAIAGWTTFAVCASTAFAYHYAMPMSETFIAYLLVLVSLLAARMILAERPSERLVAAIVLGGPVTAVCLMLGLTVALANALIAFACLLTLVLELVGEPANWRTLLRDRRCWTAYAVVAGLVIATLLTTRADTLYFWAVDSNWYRNISALPNLQWTFSAHAAAFLHFTEPFGSRHPELLLALIAFCGIALFEARRREDRAMFAIRLLLFAALIVAAAVMTQWRTNIGYKSATMFGLTVGVVLLAAQRLSRNWRSRSALWLTPLWLLALGQIMFLPAATAYSSAPAARPPAFEASQICRLDQTNDCRCVQVMVYGPQLFLLNDMRPCPNRNLTFDGNAGTHPVTRQWLFEDAKNPSMAFWTFEPDALMLENGVPPELVRFWRTQARCVSIDAENAFCFRRE